MTSATPLRLLTSQAHAWVQNEFYTRSPLALCYKRAKYVGILRYSYKKRKKALIMASATLCPLLYPTARRGGLRGAGGSSTAAQIVANIERGLCPKNRSAAVVPSARVRKKLCTAVRHARFLG